MLDLQEQLTTTENQIGFARQHYNATVLDYNTGIATFPNVLIAGPFGFRPEQFFDAEPEAQQVPQVNLSNLAPRPPAAPPARSAEHAADDPAEHAAEHATDYSAVRRLSKRGA